MSELILSNARLVLGGEIVEGHLVIRHGRIAALGQGPAGTAGALDCEGDLLAPGLIELHTDNLERHIAPRPGVDWPHHAAVMAHDAELAGCGITTVFDAVRVGTLSYPGRDTGYRDYARGLCDEIRAMDDLGALKISHFLHLRAEIPTQTLLEELGRFGPADGVRLMSLMDHTPGQRQFADPAKFEVWTKKYMGLDAAEFDRYCRFLADLRAEIAPSNLAGALRVAGDLGAVLASHDDTTPAHVAESAAAGVRVAEFPTTMAAAEACGDHGIAVMMGAPNLIRGGSHSGNVAAMDLAAADRLDILSSDYVPAALLHGAVMLGRAWDDMARGLATVTAAPARALGLADRGRLAEGLRGDVLRFRVTDAGIPMIRGVWSGGRQVA
ncbi:alpha-D-ribose 1-methylphosphonate 5-triphosphate diphosphatase [Mangrovicoccus algicola]|uniref:Alpha-D-ribose 1-methylphosphonate 5-triphosphate diphosphatase n=1 Tax=Mangrovicoccus algicola TaxID=2771008 RepID=A0A8J6YZE3_9RHOB|nr:alpha-D-ribose 1-methylphosphonate 5-triphosphate diphosphatase [Mangrovicoccus algicola]MBE3638648.1 alpha-D-ribose 1-methylphosphonate 5-triphosphate diphosphatase [Mangrovicoccus algicola]